MTIRILKTNLIITKFFFYFFGFMLAISLFDGIDSFLGSLKWIFIVFGSVVAHELGHAKTAQYFGHKCDDIYLLPFGGAASMGVQLYQIKLKERLLIATNGPMVSLALIILSLIYLLFLPDFYGTITFLFAINVILFVFNVFCPMLPLDGGRIAQAILSRCLGEKKSYIWLKRISIATFIIMMLLNLLFVNNIFALAFNSFVFVLMFLAGLSEMKQAQNHFHMLDMENCQIWI